MHRKRGETVLKFLLLLLNNNGTDRIENNETGQVATLENGERERRETLQIE